MSLAPLYGAEPRTRPVQSKNSNFDLQHRETNLRRDRENLAAERQQLAEERRKLVREKQEWEELQEERAERRVVEQHRIEQHTEQRRTEATAIAADLGNDMDANRPGYTAGLIIAAAKKARGLSGVEEPTGLAAAIVRQGRIMRGEIADTPALPENLVARAVVLCGMRARGDPVSGSDAAFLNSYLEKISHGR
jgi:hypothetical protein